MPRTFGRWWTVLGYIWIITLALVLSPDNTMYAQSTPPPTPLPLLQNLTVKLVQPNIDFRLERPAVLYQGSRFLKHALWRPGHNQIAISYAGDTVIDIIDGTTGQILNHLETPSKVIPADGIYDLAWSQDGITIAASFNNEVINVWELSGNTVKSPLVISYENVRSKEDPTGDLGRTPFVSISPDHKRLAVVWGSEKRNVHIWSLPDGHLLKTMSDWPAQGISKNDPAWVKWSPDGRYFVVGTWLDTLRAYSTSTYQLVAEQKRPTCVNPCSQPLATWSPDGKSIGTIHCQLRVSGCTVFLWNIEAKTTAGDETTAINGIFRLAPVMWRSDGRYIVSAEESTRDIYVWDSSTLKIAVQISGFEYPVISASWNQDNSQFLTAYKDLLVIWKVVANS